MNRINKVNVTLCIILALLLSTTAIVVEKTTIEEITKTSNAIVYGKVVGKKSVWEGNRINTYLTLTVYETAKGNGITDQITVKQMGGSIGPYADVIDGQPNYEIGDEVFFFLIDWKDNYWIHSIAVGGYSVVRTGGQVYVINDFNNITIRESSNKKLGEALKPQYLLSEIISRVKSSLVEN